MADLKSTQQTSGTSLTTPIKVDIWSDVQCPWCYIGQQAQMKERLLKAYFVEGKHVGRIEDLADLAESIGLDRAEAREALTNSQYLPAVKADVAQAEAYGISGVPFYVIDGKFGVSGAQNPETFKDVLEQAREERHTP